MPPSIQTPLVYLLTTILMMAFCYATVRTGKFRYTFGAILVYALVFGFRWNVGADFLMYFDNYQYRIEHGCLEPHMREHWEIGFRLLTDAMAGARLHFVFFFALLAFIPVFLFYYSLRKEYEIFVFMTFTLMMGATWLGFSNALRQVVALGFFVLGLSYLNQRKVLPYVLLILLASLFHKSALLLLVLAPIYYYRRSCFNNRYLEFGLVALALVLMLTGALQNYYQFLSPVIKAFGYGAYENSKYARVDGVSPGLGFLLTFILNCLLIYYSKDVKKSVSETSMYPILYDVYFVGLFLSYAFFGVQAMGRLAYYFYTFSFVIGAYTMYYSYREKKYPLLAALTFIYCSLFVATMYRMSTNLSLYRFFWEATTSYKAPIP